MSRKRTILQLGCLCIVGSVISFYAINLILSDVSNMFYMTLTKDVISSLPMFFIALDFIALSILVMRQYMRAHYRKSQGMFYCLLVMIFSVLGAISSVLTGIVVYHSFTVPYPFPGAVLICLFWHIAAFAAAFIGRKKYKKLPDDAKKRKLSVSYVVYTIMLSILTFYSYNRFGAFLWMPVYVHLRTLPITFTFYLSLLLPLLLWGFMCIYVFKFHVGRPKLGFIYVSIVMILNIVMAVVVFSVGMTNTQFVSAVSPALAIERLLTKPVDTIFHFAVTFLIGLYCWFFALRKMRTNNDGKYQDYA